jgi:uncharacterized protein
MPNFKGIYVLFYDAQNRLGYKCIIHKETSNEVSLSSILKGDKAITFIYTLRNYRFDLMKEFGIKD